MNADNKQLRPQGVSVLYKSPEYSPKAPPESASSSTPRLPHNPSRVIFLLRSCFQQVRAASHTISSLCWATLKPGSEATKYLLGVFLIVLQVARLHDSSSWRRSKETSAGPAAALPASATPPRLSRSGLPPHPTATFPLVLRRFSARHRSAGVALQRGHPAKTERKVTTAADDE